MRAIAHSPQPFEVTTMTLNRTLLVAALVCGGLEMPALAATATTTFQVQMTITKSCAVSATNLNFGSTLSSAINVTDSAAGTVTVTCSKNTPYTVGLAPSAANGGTANGTGAMNGTGGNTDKVPYNLYSNAVRTTVWGDTPGTNTVAGTGTGAAQAALSVYGLVPSANYTPDTYADTVTVNVVY